MTRFFYTPAFWMVACVGLALLLPALSVDPTPMIAPN